MFGREEMDLTKRQEGCVRFWKNDRRDRKKLLGWRKMRA